MKSDNLPELDRSRPEIVLRDRFSELDEGVDILDDYAREHWAAIYGISAPAETASQTTEATEPGGAQIFDLAMARASRQAASAETAGRTTIQTTITSAAQSTPVVDKDEPKTVDADQEEMKLEARRRMAQIFGDKAA